MQLVKPKAERGKTKESGDQTVVQEDTSNRGYRPLVTRLGGCHGGSVRAWSIRVGPSNVQGDGSCQERCMELVRRLLGEQKWCWANTASRFFLLSCVFPSLFLMNAFFLLFETERNPCSFKKTRAWSVQRQVGAATAWSVAAGKGTNTSWAFKLQGTRTEPP